jgi:hypothetical protein
MIGLIAPHRGNAMPLHADKRTEIERELKKAARRLRQGEELSLRAIMADTGFSWYLIREVAIDLGLWRKSGGWKTARRRGLSIRFSIYRKVVKAAQRKGISPEEYAEDAIRDALARDRKARQLPRPARRERRPADQADAAS